MQIICTEEEKAKIMIQCRFCGYRQQTKGRKDFRCKWCGHRITVRRA